MYIRSEGRKSISGLFLCVMSLCFISWVYLKLLQYQVSSFDASEFSTTYLFQLRARFLFAFRLTNDPKA